MYWKTILNILSLSLNDNLEIIENMWQNADDYFNLKQEKNHLNYFYKILLEHKIGIPF